MPTTRRASDLTFRRRRGWWAASCSAALLLAGACGERSNVAPDAAVTVRGTVTDADGTPLASRPVRLGSGVTVAEGGAGALTVGLFCFSGECSGDFFDATTDDDGSYAFELTGRDTQSAFGEAASFLLSTSAEPQGEHPTGPAISARFRIQATDVALPALGLVDPDLHLGSDAAEVISRWDGAAAPGPYTVAFAAVDDVPAWEAQVVEPAWRGDGRVLEDTTGVVTVSGSRTDSVEGSDLAVTWRSAGLAFRGGFGAPPSRGASCELRSADGAVRALERCPLTDGSFQGAGLPTTVCSDPAAGSSTTGCAPVRSVRLRLPAPVPADLLVVRGCTDPCRAAVAAAEEAAATDVGPISGPFAAATLPGSPVAAVELTTDDVSSLAEVSLWSPAVATDGQPLLPAELPATLDGVEGEGSSGRRVAVGAAIALLVGAAVLIGRARRALSTR